MNEPGTNAAPRARFGTFQGVFRPTFLTILGAMLYLREGWLVGSGGLLGALAVIFGATLITGTTALSAASIATNQRVRPGGAFAIISQALGLEAGGAIGWPLFVAQALSAAMYAYAFAEVLTDTALAVGGPTLPLVPVALVAFIAVAGLAIFSSTLVVKAQGWMFVLVLAALASLFAGVFTVELQVPTLLPDHPETGLIDDFAIFFPAVTGIMVGVGMSGQLADPRKAIPKGTLGAWGVTTALYALAAVWYSLVATPEDLVNNKTLAFDAALVGPLVRAGLLASTLMAALSSLVAAGGLLFAMAEQQVVPRWQWLSVRDKGEARRATFVTMAVGSLGLLSGGLDAIAPIITAFFLLTYLALNAVVGLEQRLGMISFRPTFQISPMIPLVGALAAALGLFLASPRLILMLGLLAVLVIYWQLGRKTLETPWETVRSGISVAIATWAARRALAQGRSERAWKPDLLAPLVKPADTEVLGPLTRFIAGQRGSVRLMPVGTDATLAEATEALRRKLDRSGVLVTTTPLSAEVGPDTLPTALDAMQGDLLRPNLLILDLRSVDDATAQAARQHCQRLGIGLALFMPGTEGTLGKQQDVNVWLSDRSPDWAPRLHDANLDLPVLIGWLVATAWNGRLSLVTALRGGTRDSAEAFLHSVVSACRLPADTRVMVKDQGAFLDVLRASESADLSIFGMPPVAKHEQLMAITEAAGGPCLFLLDAGLASAFA